MASALSMNCRDCPRYDAEASRCRDGKVNPHSWDLVIQVSNVMGKRAICPLNDFRERLLGARGRSARPVATDRRPPSP